MNLQDIKFETCGGGKRVQRRKDQEQEFFVRQCCWVDTEVASNSGDER